MHKTFYLCRISALPLVVFLSAFASGGVEPSENQASQKQGLTAFELPQPTDLVFWNQTFVRDKAYEHILSLPLQQNEQMNKFRGLYFKKLGEGMDLTEVDANMKAAFQRFNDAEKAAYAQLFQDLVGLAAAMMAYQAPPCSQDAFVYVAMGASLAQGAGADPPSKGYVYLIGERLRQRFPNVCVRNLAVGGKTTQHAREVQLPAALACHPNLVTYSAGLNDLQYGVPVETARENTDFVLKGLREQTKAKIVMTRMSVAEKLPALTADIPKLQARHENLSPERVAAFNQAYTELAAKYDVTLVDVGGIIDASMPQAEVDKLFSVDGVHPNNTGHIKVADVFWAGIVKALGLQ
jgi:lysophospholipase L1-like esterase